MFKIKVSEETIDRITEMNKCYVLCFRPDVLRTLDKVSLVGDSVGSAKRVNIIINCCLLVAPSYVDWELADRKLFMLTTSVNKGPIYKNYYVYNFTILK
jgi:hypothetical protein